MVNFKSLLGELSLHSTIHVCMWHESGGYVSDLLSMGMARDVVWVSD